MNNSAPIKRLNQSDANALMQLYAAGHHAKLEALLTKMAPVFSQDPLIYTMLGATLTAQQKTDQAISAFNKAIALDPLSPDAHSNLGTALKTKGDTDAAIKSYRRAIELNPKHAGSHYNLGIALHTLGRFAEAAECTEKAIKIQPRYPQAYSNLGVTLQMQGDLKGAKKNFLKALEQNSQLAEAHYNLHSVLLDPEDMVPAIEALEKAVAFAPNHHRYALMLGIVLDYSGRQEEAQPYFKIIEEKGRPLYKARLDAWQYLKKIDPLPRIFGSPIDAFKMGFKAAPQEGLVMEFGVRFGASIRQIAALCGEDQPVHGFDSFEGLPEDWHSTGKGAYTTKGVLPEVPENVTLHQGWFEDTLPSFAEKHGGPVRLMNIDCDIYSSTKTILDIFAKQIVPGSVLIFDEYIGNRHWRDDEFKAFQEAVKAYGWTYEYLGFSFVTKQTVVRIL